MRLTASTLTGLPKCAPKAQTHVIRRYAYHKEEAAIGVCIPAYSMLLIVSSIPPLSLSMYL
jgi:hypothetical protein